jgi:hypothetical protein
MISSIRIRMTEKGDSWRENRARLLDDARRRGRHDLAKAIYDEWRAEADAELDSPAAAAANAKGEFYWVDSPPKDSPRPVRSVLAVTVAKPPRHGKD